MSDPDPQDELAPRNDVEQRALNQVSEGAIAWQPESRTREGNLVLHAEVPCGAKNPDKIRDAWLEISPTSMTYRRGDMRAKATSA
jgi:hypothetical protein